MKWWSCVNVNFLLESLEIEHDRYGYDDREFTDSVEVIARYAPLSVNRLKTIPRRNGRLQPRSSRCVSMVRRAIVMLSYYLIYLITLQVVRSRGWPR